jgi:hypothetical protein
VIPELGRLRQVHQVKHQPSYLVKPSQIKKKERKENMEIDSTSYGNLA